MTKEIWIDEKTGLPMHSHHIPIRANDGGISHLKQFPVPCNCGDKSYDAPLRAVHHSNKEDQQEQRP